MSAERKETYTVNIFHPYHSSDVTVSLDWEDSKNTHHEKRAYPSTQEMLKIINRGRFLRSSEVAAGLLTFSTGIVMGVMANFPEFSAYASNTDYTALARTFLTIGGVTGVGSGYITMLDGAREVLKLSAINRKVSTSFLRFAPRPTNQEEVAGGTQA